VKSNRLAELHKHYESILQSAILSEEKDKKLAALMTSMEREFSIPLLQNAKWEREHKPVIALYRIISESRESLK